MNAAQRKKARKMRKLLEMGRHAETVVQSAETQVAQAAALVHVAEEDFREVARQRDGALRDADRLRATLAEVRRELAGTRERLETFEHNHAQAVKSLEQATTAVRVMGAELDRLRAQDSDAASLRKRLKKRGEELDAARDKVNRLETQLRASRREDQQSIAYRRSDLASLDAQVPPDDSLARRVGGVR